MTGTQSFEARTALALLAGCASVALPGVRLFFKGTAERFTRLLLGAFAVSRFGLFALIFLVLRIAPRGDIPAYYWREAQSVLAHGLPYRELPSSYAPLHPYLDGMAVSVWHSPLAIIALAIVAEFLMLYVWLRTAPAFVNEPTRRVAGLLYLASPLSIQFVTIDGQDNVLIALALGLCLLLVARSRPALCGAVLGASIATVKFLPLLWVPPFFVALRARWRWVAGLAMALVLGYGFFVLKGVDVLSPLKAEGAIVSASNLPYVLTLLSGKNLPGRLLDGVLLAVLAVAFLWVARMARGASDERRLTVIAWAVPFVTLLLIVLSKKSWPNYLMLILFSLCLLPVMRSVAQRVGFAALQVLGCTAHSYWASFVSQGEAVPLHAGLMAGDQHVVILAITQVALIVADLWILYLSWKQLRTLER